jgi:hypothetical protein
MKKLLTIITLLGTVNAFAVTNELAGGDAPLDQDLNVNVSLAIRANVTHEFQLSGLSQADSVTFTDVKAGESSDCNDINGIGSNRENLLCTVDATDYTVSIPIAYSVEIGGNAQVDAQYSASCAGGAQGLEVADEGCSAVITEFSSDLLTTPVPASDTLVFTSNDSLGDRTASIKEAGQRLLQFKFAHAGPEAENNYTAQARVNISLSSL